MVAAVVVGVDARGCWRRLRGLTAPSSDPAADVPGTLYIDCLFRPSSPRSELTDELYAWALSVAKRSDGGSGSRVTWAPDDEIAARVVTAGIPPAGSGVQ